MGVGIRKLVMFSEDCHSTAQNDITKGWLFCQRLFHKRSESKSSECARGHHRVVENTSKHRKRCQLERSRRGSEVICGQLERAYSVWMFKLPPVLLRPAPSCSVPRSPLEAHIPVTSAESLQALWPREYELGGLVSEDFLISLHVFRLSLTPAHTHTNSPVAAIIAVTREVVCGDGIK